MALFVGLFNGSLSDRSGQATIHSGSMKAAGAAVPGSFLFVLLTGAPPYFIPLLFIAARLLFSARLCEILLDLFDECAHCGVGAEPAGAFLFIHFNELAFVGKDELLHGSQMYSSVAGFCNKPQAISRK
jgi:hypothetical protein